MKIIISIIVAFGGALGVWYFLSGPDTSPALLQTDVGDTSNVVSAIKIIAFGDSLTAGFGLSLPESYPAQLELRLRERGYDVEVINSGVSGETTAGNSMRAEFIRAQNPDIVILGIGGNDALRFVSVAETERNITQTLTVLRGGEKPPHVFLLTIQSPSNAGAEYKASFDALYPKLAAEFNVTRVPFIVEEVSRNPSLLQSDGIHPTKEGYSVLVDSYVLPPVESYVKSLITP